MTTSLKNNLPVGHNPQSGVRSLRVRDALPVSLRSMTTLASTSYTPVDFSNKRVHASQVKLAVYGDGHWWFTAHLDDTSVVAGDNYAIGFSFEDSGVAGVKRGELGAGATSKPQHIRFAIQGRSDLLQRNYLQCIAGGIKFRLRQSTDAAGVFADIGDDLKWLGRQIEISISTQSGDPGPDPPIDPGNDGTVGEEEG